MLVLSRKRGEVVVIGRDIEVTVLEIRGDRVKLGLQGPAEVPIHRGELYVKIAASRAGSAAIPTACALRKGTVPFSSDENWDSPPHIDSPTA